MLDVLRSNAKSAFTWLIVVGIVVVFAINFGPGSLSQAGCGGGAAPPYAAKVNGTIVPVSEWERQYSQLFQLYRQQTGGALTRELADQLGLPGQALDQIVDRELVVQDAKRRGVAVTRQELTRAVHAVPAFQENGRFSYPLYEDSTRAIAGSPAKFEAGMKDDLLYQKMMTAVRQTVKVSEGEVRGAFETDSDRVALAFVAFPIAAAKAEVARPGDAEAKALADKDPARVQKFYDDNRARFDQKQKARVRHVLARVAPGADDGAARRKIEEAAARVKKGEDFAEVARALSEDENTKASGGELGFVSEGLFDEEFTRAALALQAGQVSEPVRSASGWHLLRAEEVVPAKQVPLEAARLDIARELLVEERARKLAGERARAALEAARGGKALTALFPSGEAARAAGRKAATLGGAPVVAEETGPFTRAAGAIPKLGQAPGLVEAAFAAKKGEVLGKPFETPSAVVVAAVTQRETPNPAAFEGRRAALATRLRNAKETEVVAVWLKALRDEAKIETNPSLLAGGMQR